MAIYNPPLTPFSTPAAIFNNGNPANSVIDDQVAFSPTGDLFAMATSDGVKYDRINRFTQPLSSASTVSQVITNTSTPPPSPFSAPLNQFSGLVVDSNENLFVTGLSSCSAAGGVFPPPYISFMQDPGSGCDFETEFGPLAVSGTELVTTFFRGSNQGGVSIGSTGIVVDPGPVAVDPTGNLYVANGFDNVLRVFAPPFTNSSVPIITLPLPGVFGIAAGK